MLVANGGLPSSAANFTTALQAFFQADGISPDQPQLNISTSTGNS